MQILVSNKVEFRFDVVTTHRNALRVATRCNTLQRTATRCITLQHTAPHTCYGSQSHAKLRFRSILLQHTVTRCNTLHHTATHCNTLQHIPVLDPGPMQITIRIDLFTTHCNTLQHNATHCNTLQHIPVMDPGPTQSHDSDRCGFQCACFSHTPGIVS